MSDRFAINFHETFSLSRVSLSQVLAVARGTVFSKKALADTPLGTNYQKAMPRYAYRAGLFDTRGHLTPFGRFVVQSDPGLERIATQWVLHYHLAAPHSPTAFWHHLIQKRFRSGNSFTKQDLVDDLTKFIMENTGKAPTPRSIRGTVAVFVGTYMKADGLRALNLLEEVDTDTYRVSTIESPPLWAFGYALTEYWQAHYGQRLTINLDDLTEGGFASVFLIGEERMMELLLRLKQEGMVDLYRISRPYQVVLLQPHLEYALQRMYQA